MAQIERWPALEWTEWRETAQTLHLWTQIVGKVRLALTPWLNHSWHVALYVTARGLTTSPIAIGQGIVQIDFDFVADMLRIVTSDGREADVPLTGGGSIADFYRRVMAAFDDLDVIVAIDPHPSELPDAIRFDRDHAPRVYDADAARRFWRVLIEVDRIFGAFRTGFLGKASPIHFFWGSFDLASTRFSGRVAPRHPGGIPALPDAVTCDAYSHEEASVGFWPGSDAFPHAAFYAYAYPAPEEYAAAAVEPEAAYFDAALGEFILRYDDVRSAPDPDMIITAFLQSTYAAAAELGGWERGALECPFGVARRPRIV